MFNIDEMKLLGRVGSHPFYRDGQTVVVLCESSMAGGGVTVTEATQNKLYEFIEHPSGFDCFYLLRNTSVNWEREVPHDELPNKPMREFRSGDRGFIIDQQDFADDFGPDTPM